MIYHLMALLLKLAYAEDPNNDFLPEIGTLTAFEKATLLKLDGIQGL